MNYPSIYNFGLEVSPLKCDLGSQASRGLPFATRARKWELSIQPQEVRIENESDRKFSKSKFFKVFLKTTFLHNLCCPDHYEPNFFLNRLKMKILITLLTKIVQFVLRKLVKNKNFDYVINDQTPPPVINRKHLETPPRLIT